MSDLALAPKSIPETAELAQRLSKSALLAEAYRGKEADVFVTLLAGSELGLLPMQSLNAFDVIKGRAAMKPVAMLALVRSHPRVEYVRVEASPTSATISTKLKGDDFIARTTFTMAQATAAGLASNDAYRKFPQQMLTWRCTGLHCRTHHSEIIGGFYTTEEAESIERDVTPAPSVVDAQPAVESAKAAIKRRMKVVEADAPKPTPPPAVQNFDEAKAGDPTLEWPTAYVGKTLSQLTEKQLDWCVTNATKEAEKPQDEASGAVWAKRIMEFTDEVARRMADQVAS